MDTQETTAAAAFSIRSTAGIMREQVYDALKNMGPMTDEEMQILLDMNPSTQRPRRIELVADGLVINTGATRKTRSGRDAVLWQAVP